MILLLNYILNEVVEDLIKKTKKKPVVSLILSRCSDCYVNDEHTIVFPENQNNIKKVLKKLKNKIDKSEALTIVTESTEVFNFIMYLSEEEYIKLGPYKEKTINIFDKAFTKKLAILDINLEENTLAINSFFNHSFDDLKNK